MSELKLIDTYEVELCSTEPIEIAKFNIKNVLIDNTEVKVGQYVFLKNQGKQSSDNGIFLVQKENLIAKVFVEAKAYFVHVVAGQKNRCAMFLWSQNLIRRIDVNTDKLSSGNFVTKQGDELIAELSIPSGMVVGTSEPQTLKNKTIDIKENMFLNLTEDIFPKISASKIAGDIAGNAANVYGTVDVAHGGTGASVLHANRFVVGNGNNPVITNKNVPEGDVVGTTDTQNLTNKIINGQLNNIQGITNESIVTLEGKKILGDIPGKAENVNGIIDTKHGGTGLSVIPANSVLVSGLPNTTSFSTKQAPESNFVGQDDQQTLTNKTISAKHNHITDLSDDNITGISGTKVTSDIHHKSAGIVGVLTVQHGGTGVTNFEPGCVLQSGHSLEVITKKKVPLGDLVGTSDEQTLSNKTIDAALNSIRNISDGHIAWVSGSKIRGNINGTAEALSGTNDVQHGGTGRQLLPLDCVLIGNGAQTLKCEMKAPKTGFVGLDDEQKLTKKTIDARENTISGITTGNVSSLSGSVIHSDIEHNAKNVNGIVDADHGGTGLAKFEAKRFITTGADPKKLLAEKQVPQGDIVGTSDTQVLKNKIIDAQHNNLSNITDENIKTISGSKITGNISGGAAFVHDVVMVPNGGTGLKKIPKGHVLIGSGDNFCDTRPLPVSEIVGTTDAQTLFYKSIDAKHNVVLNLEDKSILNLSGAKILGDISGNARSINGVLNVFHGGTGLEKLPSDEVLIGDDTKLRFKKAPVGDFVGTEDKQTLLNKTLDGGKNTILNIPNESIVSLAGSKVTGNIPGNASGIYGILEICNGGTGLKDIPSGFFLTGEEHKITTRHKIPKGEICGTEETQTLNHKIIDADHNDIKNLTTKNIAQLDGIRVTGDIYGRAGGVNGVVEIEHGGTGCKTVDEVRQKLCVASAGHNRDIKSIEGLEFLSFKNHYTTGVKLCVQKYAVDWNWFLPSSDGPEGHVLTTNGYGVSEWGPAMPCMSKVGYVDAAYGAQYGRCRKTIREIVEKEFPVIVIAPGTYREICYLKGHIKGFSQKEVTLSGNFIICKGSIVEGVTFANSKILIESDCQIEKCNFHLSEVLPPSSNLDTTQQQIMTLLNTVQAQLNCSSKTEFKNCRFIGESKQLPISCSQNTFSECVLESTNDAAFFMRGQAWLRFCRLKCRLDGCYLESCNVEHLAGSVNLRFANTQIIDLEQKMTVTEKMLCVKPIKDNTKINGAVVLTTYHILNPSDIIEIEGQAVIEYINLP